MLKIVFFFAWALGNMDTHLSTLFLGPIWPGMVTPDRVLSMSQIERFEI